MFKIGDAVVHPAKGAGIVTGVKRMPGLQKRPQSYSIKLVGTRAKTILMIPVEKAVDSGLRPAISEANLERVWRALSAGPQALPVEHKERYELLKDRLRAGNIVQTAEVIRDLEWRRLNIDNRKLNVPGERIYQKALHMLTGELAVSQGISVESAAAQVDDLLRESLEPAAE